MRWTSYTDGGRKLDRPSKQQATVKPPPGPLVLGSTIQVVGPLLLPEDGERKVVCATFNNRVREGKPLVEYEAGCTLKRTSRLDGEGFTITVFEPDSDKPEITWEYDSRGNCESIKLASTTVMKPREAADSAEREQDDQTSDHKKIQGTWQVVHYADNGRVEPLPFALKMKLAFAEDILTYTMEEGKEEVSSFKLDASTTPKSIDLTNGDEVILGIYELRDDQLRICLTQGRKGARAVAFESKA